MNQLTSFEGLHCANCGARLQGEFCHECGQSVHSVLKPVHGMVEETIETLLHIDGRIVHTLPPLLLRPGFLTLEYFSGRRMRYIAPFRLMFVLCLLSFFVFHLAVDRISGKIVADGHPMVNVSSGDIERATNPGQVRAALNGQLDGLREARATGVLPQLALDQTQVAANDLRQRASRRLVVLGAAPMSAASVGAPLPPEHPATLAVMGPKGALGMTWGTQTPVRIAWLPAVANARLTELNRQLQANWQAVLSGDAKASAQAKQRMISGVFGVLPPTMFVLIPVFAGLLKLAYAFRRRLYMEHLIVALHSHAFIFFSLLLLTLVAALTAWLAPHAAWTGYPLGVLQGLIGLWLPIYLLIMQKRVYRQSWPRTVLKFWCIGWGYVWLLVMALAIASAVGMAH